MRITITRHINTSDPKSRPPGATTLTVRWDWTDSGTAMEHASAAIHIMEELELQARNAAKR